MVGVWLHDDRLQAAKDDKEQGKDAKNRTVRNFCRAARIVLPR